MQRSFDRGTEPTVDHDRDEPAVLGALKDEKNPAVRGYIAGLVRQVEAICERHGAKAADLGKKETQDILPTAELSSVRKLVAKILEIRKGNLDIGSKREIERGLDEREAAAREMLDQGMKDLVLNEGSVDEVAKMYLRAGMPAEADAFVETSNVQPDAELKAKMALATALDLVECHSNDAGIMLRMSCFDAASKEGSFLARCRLFDSAFQELLRFSNDGKLNLLFESTIKKLDPEFQCVALERLEMEFRRRGISMDSNFRRGIFMSPSLREIVNTMREEAWVGGLDSEQRFHLNLILAETKRLDGDGWKAHLSDAIEFARTERGNREGLVSLIADTAGMVGAFDVVDELQEADWWHERWIENKSVGLVPHAKPSLWIPAANGCVRARNFDKAIELTSHEILDTEDSKNVLLNLAWTMLDADQVEQAERVYDHFDATSRFAFLRSMTKTVYAAARARRGDDVLSEARQVAESQSRVSTPNAKAIPLINAAIATLGYVKSMRKRIAEYATKP